ncbi:lysylphosphatidylglycerol synthase transmembrane domain-containing protein [Acidithiobacillus sulfurivorans]|uniref:lysylphosphatidylglycerol synthase transmembrane domain-containing protein n=1 Tax=Acidithiobacillus sulfurivorans TaxID=1958756 RepID=UPI001C075948|nr:lysylphosphatidylglycerol synthase transmembrane domain-containing protein [Acidithiobacillus sulfurivorans]
MSRKKLHTRWQLLLQIVFTIGVLFWLLHNTNWQSLSQRFAEIRPWWFVAAMASYALNLSVSVIRWRIILLAMERTAPILWLLRLNWVGAYFNQVLPGAVSGDVIRAWYTRHQTGSMPLALAAVFGDRFMGMGALIVIAAVAFALGGARVGLLPQMGWTIGILLFAYVLIIILILSPLLNFLEKISGKLGDKLHDIRLGMSALLCHRLALSGTIVLSFAIQCISVLTFWLLAHALGEAPDAVALWVVWPVISLFLALPISFAGWGLREGLMVFYLGYLHMGHDQALALSLLLGFTMVLTSLPGALLWIGLHRHHEAPPDLQSQTGAH